MKATSNDNPLPQNHHKKGVTFDAMETLERNSDCIDRLTSLVSNMKMTMDRKNPLTNQRYTREGPRIKTQVDNILHLEIGPLVEEEIKVVIEEIIIIETIIDQIIKIDQEADGTIIGQVIGATIIRITIDKVIQDRVTDKIPSGLLGTEVKVGVEMKTTIITVQEVGVEIDMIIGPFNREEKNLGPNLTPG